MHPRDMLTATVNKQIAAGSPVFVEQKPVTAQDLIGKRIEIPVHYDLWMRGARFGTVTKAGPSKPGQSAYVYVKMDHPQVKRRLKLWALDWDYCKVL